jgi:glycosyltransferase involved in cell wall biosynthesis
MAEICKVAVIIPCFNHGEFLLEAVASVEKIGRKDVEAVVVDDGSNDARTKIEVGKILRRGIRVIRQENGGLAAARNAGISSSSAEYIFPLDADDRMRDSWLDRGIEILDADKQKGVVYGDTECFGTRTGRWKVGPFDRGKLLAENYIHASALFRRSVWEQNCGYDGAMPVQGLEDWDFWLGALEHGWQFAYLPEIFFDYRQAEQSMITRAKGFESQVGDFVARKHGALYRQEWSRLARECEILEKQQQSIKETLRNLNRLLMSRFKQKA